jgi:hypothetical protein
LGERPARQRKRDAAVEIRVRAQPPHVARLRIQQMILRIGRQSDRIVKYLASAPGSRRCAERFRCVQEHADRNVAMQDRKIDAPAVKMERSEDTRGRKNAGDPRPHRAPEHFGRNQRIGTRPFRAVRSEAEECLQNRRRRSGHARREFRVVNGMKALVLAGLALLIPAGAPAPATADTTGSLIGRVRDIADRPVPGAAVRVTSLAEVTQTTSDANGWYCFVGLVPGMYTVSIELRGYVTTSYTGVGVAAGSQTVADVRLNRPPIAYVTLRDYSVFDLVRSDKTVDVYLIARWNPLFDTSRTIDEVLPFVPGVQVIGGSPYPR